MKKLLLACLAIAASSIALAKLPPLNDEAKAKAAEATAKTAWAGKVDNYQLCKSQDKVAASYSKSAKEAKAAGKGTKPTTAASTCADPGAFVYTPPEPAKPVVAAAAAPSPAPTAASPPSKAPAATIAPAKKS